MAKVVRILLVDDSNQFLEVAARFLADQPGLSIVGTAASGEDAIRQVERLDPNVGISKGEVFYYLGEISAKQGDRAKAVQMFERAIENDPALALARTKLSELKG